MDKQAFDALNSQEKKAAMLAFETAGKISAYFQSVARKGARSGVHEPVFTPEEHQTCRAMKALSASFEGADVTSFPKKAVLKIFSTFNKWAAGEAGRESGAMAYKILLADQMNFYRDNPDLVFIFAIRTKEDGARMIEKMDRFHKGLGQCTTVPPVDNYYNEAYQDFKHWAPERVAKIQ